MALTVHAKVEQRSDEWYQLRCGMLTASTIGKLVTGKTLAVANNDTSRDLTASLVAEQVTGHVDPAWQSSEMLRGVLDEPLARDAYAKHTGQPVTEVGFMVRDDWGFPIGYSPDGLVGDDGLIEVKSRRQKRQLQDVVAGTSAPGDAMAQIQCGLLVAGRAWCDYVSFSGGMSLWVSRVPADPRWQDALVAAAAAFHDAARVMGDSYRTAVAGLPMTERIDYDLEIRI